MSEIKVDKLNDSVCKLIKPYIEKMIELHKDNLISVVLYGSAVGDDFVMGKSNVNLVLIFKKIALNVLSKSLKLVDKGRKKKILAPLFFTVEHVNTSTDVFPIEFLEIKENHIVVYGEDVFTNLEISSENLRLQCEQQLKGKLIRLRQSYLELGLQKKGIELLLHESLSSLIPVFRNMLRLKGKTPSVSKEEVINEFAREFEISANVFITILKDKKGDEKIGGLKAEEFFAKYLDEIQKLAVIVDKL